MGTKQTAVEWFFDNLENHEIQAKHYDLYQQAKAMEKEQIKDAFVECYKANVPDGFECKLDAEQYYNETYGAHN